MRAELTLAELAAFLDPPLGVQQARVLTALAGIEPAGLRRHRGRGRPAAVYPAGAVIRAHAEEVNRTSRPFDGTDWIAASLLARGHITADPPAGEIRWADGSRAEELLPTMYGAVRYATAAVPAHRIVVIAADGEIPAGIQVNHVNLRRWDNRRVNLELVAFIANIRPSRPAAAADVVPAPSRPRPFEVAG